MNLLRNTLLALGFVAVFAGTVGVFVPLLPTTPFLILAVFLFSKSSPRFHSWLLNHPRFGETLRNWESHQVIPLKAKILATFFVSLGIAFAAFYKNLEEKYIFIISLVMFFVLFYIWTRKSKITEI